MVKDLYVHQLAFYPSAFSYQVEYAQTSFTSRLVRLHNISGEARIKQSFVFAAVRPLTSKLLQVSVWVTHNKTRVGHQVGKLTEDIIDLLRQSQRAEMEKQACIFLSP